MNFLGLSLAANKHDVFHFRVLNNIFMNFSMFSYLIPRYYVFIWPVWNLKITYKWLLCLAHSPGNTHKVTFG